MEDRRTERRDRRKARTREDKREERRLFTKFSQKFHTNEEKTKENKLRHSKISYLFKDPLSNALLTLFVLSLVVLSWPMSC